MKSNDEPPLGKTIQEILQEALTEYDPKKFTEILRELNRRLSDQRASERDKPSKKDAA